MNIQEYISSGILELYAMGELSGSEKAEVEQACQNYDEIRRELSLIESTLSELAIRTAIAPNPEIKEKIKAQLDLSQSNSKEVSMPVAPARFAVAASVSVAILASVLAFYFYNQWQDTEDRLSALIVQNQEVADNYQLVNQRLQRLEADVEILSNPNFIQVAMNGTDNSPESLGTVYWNRATEEVYLKIQNLKTLSHNQQYQLWAIVDGVPVDVGVFDHTVELLKMKSIAAASAFAVTIEPTGGSENPSLETMQVIGTIGV